MVKFKPSKKYLELQESYHRIERKQQDGGETIIKIPQKVLDKIKRLNHGNDRSRTNS